MRRGLLSALPGAVLVGRGRSALRTACSGPPSRPLAASCLLDVPCGYAFVGGSLP